MITAINASSPSIMSTIADDRKNRSALKGLGKSPVHKKSPRQLMTTGPGHVFSKFVSRVTVRPSKQLVVPIGNTFTGATPKGFSIGLSPGNDIEESVNMQVTAYAVDKSTPNKFEYKLHVVNNGNKTISAEVWAL